MNVGKEFYPLTPSVAKKLREAKLTAAEWRIWTYLVEIDPWGDRYRDLDTLTVMTECEVSKATFYRAIGKFQDLGLFDFQDKGWFFKNETGVSKMRQKSQNCETPLKTETAVAEMRNDSQKCENQSPKPAPSKDSGSPQTSSDNTDLNQTDQIGNEQPPPPIKPPVEVEIVATEEEKLETPLSQESKNLVPTRELQETHEDNFSAAAEANVKFLEEIERIAYDWKKRPWMASATKFKSEMIKAVWQCNPTYYSIRGTQTPNQQHIVKALKLRDQQLQSLDELAINAYHELNRWWNTAKALANPHVQHAFVAAANQSKEQVEELEKQRRIEQTLKDLEGL